MVFKRHIGTGDGLGRADHPELELVAGKGKGRGPVAVGIVLGQIRQGIDADLRGTGSRLPCGNLLTLGQAFQDIGQLIAQEDWR